MKIDVSTVFAIMAAFGGWYLMREDSHGWVRAFDYALIAVGVVGTIAVRVRRARKRSGATAPVKPGSEQ